LFIYIYIIIFIILVDQSTNLKSAQITGLNKKEEEPVAPVEIKIAAEIRQKSIVDDKKTSDVAVGELIFKVASLFHFTFRSAWDNFKESA
jgi:hypothetical protein